MPRPVFPARSGPPPPFTAAQCDHIFPWHRNRHYNDPPLFDFLMSFAVGLLFRAMDGFPFIERTAYSFPARLHRPYARNPARVIARIDRAIIWLDALRDTIAGSTKFLRPLRPRKLRVAAASTPAQANSRAPTPYNPVLADRNRMLRAFQTRTIAQIIHKISIPLGLARGHDEYPEFLLTFHETPAECARRHHGPPPAKPKPPRRRQHPHQHLWPGQSKPTPAPAPAPAPEPDTHLAGEIPPTRPDYPRRE